MNHTRLLTRSLTLSFCLFLSNVSIAENSIWTVGINYVAFYKNGSNTYWREITPNSYAFDKQSCSLWIVDDDTSNLMRFSPAQQTPSNHGKTRRIVSSLEHSYFYTQNDQHLEKRSAQGVQVGIFALPWISDTLQMSSFDNGSFSFLQKNEKTLALLQTDSQFKNPEQTTVSEGVDLWNVEKQLANPATGDIWVGYTATTLTHSYSPILKKYSSSDKMLFSKTYHERGIFWDFCLREDASILFSYDIPTSNAFTLPIYSYLDAFKQSANATRYYEAETNYFIDSVSCGRNSIYMLQRPIFGSEKSRITLLKSGLVGSANFNASSEEQLVLLDNKAQKIFHCD